MTSINLRQVKPSTQKKSPNGPKKQLNIHSLTSSPTGSKQSMNPPKVTTTTSMPLSGGWASIAAAGASAQSTQEKRAIIITPSPQTSQSPKISASKIQESKDQKQKSENKNSSSSPDTLSDTIHTLTVTETSNSTTVESSQLPQFNREEIQKYLHERSAQLNKSAIQYKTSGSDWTTSSKHSGNRKGKWNNGNQSEKERDIVAWELSKLVQRN